MKNENLKPEENICIVNCGIRTPVGTSASMSAAMVRAEITRLLRHPFVQDENDNPLVMGLASYIEDDDPMERFKELSLPAIDEVIKPLLDIDYNNPRLQIFTGLPEKRPGFSDEAVDKFTSILTKKIEGFDKFDFNIETISHGHSSGLIAIEKAFKQISCGKADFCITGGVESYFAIETLAWLNAINRLKSSENKLGFIPGEAAGFCLLTSEKTAKRFKLPIHATIMGVNTSYEKNLIGEDSVCTGEGLSRTFGNVLKALPEGAMVNQVLCDLNGERYRTDEYGFAYLRNKKHFESADNFISPVNRWGDIGAATAPNLINIAIESNLNKYSKGPYNLIWTSSDAGERSAALIKLMPV